jgi:hypothetical protein
MNKNIKLVLSIFILGILFFSGWYFLKPIKAQKGDFIKAGKMSIPRYNHQTVLLDDGRVLIIGGSTFKKFGEGPTNKVEIYDPKTKRFLSIGKLHKTRDEYTATKLNNGKVLIAGGRYGNNSEKSTELYNPKANRFEIGPNMHFSRMYHTATLLEDGRVLISGGEELDLTRKKLPLSWNIEQSEIYDPRINKFVIAAKMNIQRFKHSCVLLTDGKVLITGGVGTGPKFLLLSSAEIYNPKTNEFNLAGNMNLARVNPNIYLLKNGKVLISGGNRNGSSLREIEIYDPKMRKFIVLTKRTSMPDSPSEVLLKNDKVLFTGGSTGVGLSLQYYKASEIYNPETNKFSEGKNMNKVRAGHAATLLKNGDVLITGGYGEKNSKITELYVYDAK